MQHNVRLAILRDHALSRRVDGAEWAYLHDMGRLLNRDEASFAVRTAKEYAYAFENASVVIDPGELVVGKRTCRALTPEEDDRWNVFKENSAAPSIGGQDSHMAVDFDLLLKRGVCGVKEDIAERASALKPENPSDYETLDFYRSCEVVLDGVIALARRYAALAAELAEKEADEGRRLELAAIAAICARVPENAAGSFYEAVQSVHFLNFCLGARSGLYQLGRPDRYLIEYYRRDIASGALTEDAAQILIDCLGILLNENISSSLAIGLMVGGTDENGCDVSNELTRLFIRSIENVRMIYPGVGLCVSKDTPRDVLDLAYAMLAQGLSHPALFNDEIIIKGLRRYGLPPSEACQYIHSTCVEITPVASSACWVASPYTNLPQLVLDCIPSGAESYEAFEALFYEKLGAHIKGNVIAENKTMMERTRNSRNPLVSCFVNDCIAKGRDIEANGARYNWIMPSFVGAANAVDALVAVKRLVYDEKAFNLTKLSEMLRADFESYEKERLTIKGITKYGNDDDETDAVMIRLTEFLADECSKYTTYRGGRFIPSLFCWIMHERFGRNTCATPDGRKAGFPLGDGSGPSQGNELEGPTASVLSATKWRHDPFIGGVAVNMKFSKKLFKPERTDALNALVKAYLDRGGFELQINVVDRETLLAAQANPERYADLVVRVGGYSDYFVRLPRQMQNEVLQRTEYMI